MLVTDLINVRYLSGFSGSNGALLVFADDREAHVGHRRPVPHPGRGTGA